MIRFRAIGKAMEKAVAAFSILNLFGLFILTIYLVVARYLLDRPAAGVSEIALICAVQLYMAGALLASIRGEQIQVDLFPAAAGGRARAVAVALVTLIVTLFFCWWSYRMLAWGMARPQTTPSLGLPLWIPQVSFMGCALGCVFIALRDIVIAFLPKSEVTL